MPSVDPGATDDDELALYVAAFRRVEQPEPARRDASWKAIERELEPRPRTWLWAGAAALLAAAVWLLWSTDMLRALQIDADGAETGREQAGYVPVEDVDGEQARTRVPTPRAVPQPTVIEAPVLETPAVIETPSATPSKRNKLVRTPGTLADETALFAEIQQALLAGRSGRALSSIARHEREFPKGAFVQERMVAKAQALCAAGKRVAARKLRDRFVARNPSSHLAPRMRAVCPE